MKLFRFKSEDNLDRAFEVGILLKALDGILETIGGLLLLLVSPSNLNSLARAVTQGELSEDKQDFVARHILHSAQHLTSASLLFAAVYLLAHGLSKIILVVEIIRERYWAYVGLVVLTVGFIIYQLYRMTIHFTLSLLLLTIFDCVVVYLTAREYDRRNKSLLAKSQG